MKTTYLFSLFVISWWLTGCSDNQEIELKQNYYYQSTNIKVKTKRIFTRQGEILDTGIINSIYTRKISEDTNLELPRDINMTNDQKVQILFKGSEAILTNNTKTDTFNVNATRNMIRLTSKDTIAYISVSTGLSGSMQMIPYNLGKYYPEYEEEATVASGYGFVTLKKTFFEIYLFYEGDGIIMPYIFYYFYRNKNDQQNNWLSTKVSSSTIQNVLDQDFYKQMQPGDTVLLQEMHMFLK